MKSEYTLNWHMPIVCLPLATADTTVHKCCEETPSCNQEEHVQRNREFETLLLEAVDEGLSLFGCSLKQVIYQFLENDSKVRKQDIPHKIHEFADGIEKIFGDGAKLIEIQIMKQLYKKVGDVFEYDPNKDDLHFTEYVEAAEFSIKRQSVPPRDKVCPHAQT